MICGYVGFSNGSIKSAPSFLALLTRGFTECRTNSVIASSRANRTITAGSVSPGSSHAASASFGTRFCQRGQTCQRGHPLAASDKEATASEGTRERAGLSSFPASQCLMPTHPGFRVCGVGLVLQAAPVTHQDQGVHSALQSAPLAQSCAPENASVPDNAPSGATHFCFRSNHCNTLIRSNKISE